MERKNCTKNWKRMFWFVPFIVFSISFISQEVWGNCNSSGVCIIAFNTSTTWDVPEGIGQIDVLLVGGGGGGAGHPPYSSAGGGGGGAGGLIYRENHSLNQTSYFIAIGAGGAGTNQNNIPAENGGDTIAFNLTALGGGGGILTAGTDNTPASNGGSGGGGRQNPAGAATQPVSIWGGFGNNGARNLFDDGGAGGGGAGTQPANISGTDGGDGGDGLYYGNIFGDQFGDSGYFAGGGGGGGDAAGGQGFGGLGGGGDGGSDRDSIAPTSGMTNTGGGGGGGESAHGGADGGSGVVIIRFIDNIFPTINITSPLPINYTNSTTQLLEINVTDNIDVDRIWYNWNGTNVTYTSSINIDFGEGTTTITTWVNDTAGNINSINVTFIIDVTAPNITIYSPLNVTYNSTEILLDINATDINGIDRIWYNWNGTNVTYITSVNITFNEGINVLQVWANDTFNNLNTENVSFVSDREIDNVTLISPINNVKLLVEDLQVLLRWFVYDEVTEIVDCEIFVNSINIANQSCQTNVESNYTLNVSRGNYNWSIRATNILNNSVNSSLQNFTVIEKNYLGVEKLIENVNTNLYVVRTRVQNFLNKTTGFNLFEFVENSSNAGSFTPLFNFSFTVTGPWYYGDIFGWNYSANEISKTEINYSITKNSPNWRVSDSYIIGLE